MLPSTLEWHFAIGLTCLGIPLWPQAAIVAAAMWMLSLAVAGIQALRAKIAPRYDGVAARLVVALLCYLQPLVRSWRRLQTRLFGRQTRIEAEICRGFRPTGEAGATQRERHYWAETDLDRTQLLGQLVAFFDRYGWNRTIDTGWQPWDLEFQRDSWCVVRIATAQEEHGSRRRLIRLRHSVSPSGCLIALTTLATLVTLEGLVLGAWSFISVGTMLTFVSVALYARGKWRAARAMAAIDAVAASLGLLQLQCGTRRVATIRCNEPGAETNPAHAGVPAQ
jgi:hypothetical protein